jgi:hypothetical protein
MKENIIVSIDNTLTSLEHYPGEVFDSDKFAVYDTTLSNFQLNPVQVRNYTKIICAVRFINDQYPDLDLSTFNSVIVLYEEAIDGDPNKYLQKLQQKFNNNNILIVCSGYHKKYLPCHNNIYVYPYFLQNILRYNQIQQIDSISNHQRTFDVLLGGSKMHRRFVFEKLGQHRMLLNACFVNLTTAAYSADIVKTIFRTPELDCLEPTATLTPTTMNQGYNGYVKTNQGVGGMGIAQLVPWEVYRHSLYSIVTETNFENYFFFSEKTAKPLYAGRLFVFFGAQGQLQDLKQLGFKTFDSIIDESYDLIDDNSTRFEKAFEQVRWLFDQNHPQLYKKIQPVLEHNQRHIQDRQYFLGPLKQWIYDRY